MVTCRVIVRLLLALLAISFAQTVSAQECRAPINLVTNGSFDNLMTGYTGTGAWQHNTSVTFSVYQTRPTVSNPSAAPAGNVAAGYPVESLNRFAFNQTDINPGSITLPTNGADAVYVNGTLHIWFDFGWRQAGGTTTRAAHLNVLVNGTKYLDIATVDGNLAGNATTQVLNGASVNAFTSSALTAGTFSNFNTVHLQIPYPSTSIPTIAFQMVADATYPSDDFLIDRIYVPTCINRDITTVKTLASSDTTPNRGDVVSYLITVTNLGPGSAANVTMTDLLPSGLTAAAGNGSATMGSYNTTTGLWTIGNMAQGTVAKLTLSGTVNADQAGQTITNTIPAPAVGDERDPSGSTNDLTESVTVNKPDLAVQKTSSIYGTGLAIPGNDVIYSITVSNTSEVADTVDNNSIFVVDSLPPEVTFYNGPTPELGNARVGFSQTGSGLSFDPVADVRFSDAVAKPTSFAQCTYSPVAGYDPAIRHVCFRPTGTMVGGNPDPTFTVSFRTRIK